MSLKRNCDGCGAIIDDDKNGHDYPGLAVYIGESETPAYEYEDLCPKCKDRLICAIENALTDCDIVTEKYSVGKHEAPMPQQEPIRLPEPKVTSDASLSEEAIATAEQPANSVIDAIAIPKDDADERVYANGVVKQFPMRSMYTANHSPNSNG